MSQLYRFPIDGYDYKRLTPEQRQEISFALEQEYRKEGHGIDSANIDQMIVAPVNRERLSRMSCYMSPYKKMLSTEAANYAQKGFKRTWSLTNKNGTPAKIPDKQLARIEQIYDELSFNSQMLDIERRTISHGTTFLTIADHEDMGLRTVVVNPVEPTLKVKANPLFRSQPIELSFKSAPDEGEKGKRGIVRYAWGTKNVLVEKQNSKGKYEKIESQSGKHGFNGIPWAVLKYEFDNARMWGPVDFDAYSVFQTRSILVADSILRTQTSLYDILVFTGFTPQEALDAIRTSVSGKNVVMPEAKSAPDGSTIIPDLKYISPSMIEPEKVWAIWEKVWQFFMQSRGHSPKNFEVGADVQSAAAQRNSDSYILTMQTERQLYLQSFERQAWNVIRWANNRNKDYLKLNNDIDLTVDWADRQMYDTITERILHDDWRLRNNMTTIILLMMEANPDLDETTAMEQYEEMKAFNAEQRAANRQGARLEQREAAIRRGLGIEEPEGE